MKVALPSFEKRTSGTGGVFPTLSYETRKFIDTIKEGADSVPTEPASSPLPASIERELEDTISNYKTWDSKVYADLRLDLRSIRLVEILPGSSDEIHVELIRKPLDEIKNAYEALSYVWGPPNPARMIQVNGINAPVNPNLFDALFALRLSDAKRRIWIDAICVNQVNTRERSIEVRKMGEIYRLAKTVVVFLGAPPPPPASNPVSDLFKFLNRVDDGNALEEGSDGKTINIETLFQSCGVDKYDVCKGFVELCLRPWWSRIWIMQEFYLASDEPVWYWGSEHTGNAALKRDIGLLMALSWDLYWHGDTSSNFHADVQNKIGKPMPQFSSDIRRISDLISRRAATHGYDIPSRLYRELSARSTDPRDLIYGLREIFDPVFRKVFVPDYFMQSELLFACLAVFLIQFEGWGDMLWWYPFRYAPDDRRLPSWLPDFTRRVEPVETDLIPRNHLASRKNKPKLVVLNHTLHAEGYKLDSIIRHVHLGCDEYNIHRWLWQFDQVINRNQVHLNYVMPHEEQQDPWFGVFLKLCNDTSSEERNHGISHTKGGILEWTSYPGSNGSLPPNIVDCLPSWDILTGHAFSVGRRGTFGQPDDDSTAEPGLLQDIFSPRMNNIFLHTVAVDFIGACVFDWENLEFVLDRLTSASPWSEAISEHWQAMPELPSSDQTERARILIKRVRSFLTEIKETTKNSAAAWGGLYHYNGLCNAILLDCDNHAAFMRLIGALKAAGTELNEIAFDYRTRAEVDELGAVDRVVAARIQSFHSVAAKFWGRVLFETKQGFLGLTSPGVEFCGDAIAVLLDGLSFPVVMRDFDSSSGSGRFVGCTIVRGVEIQDWDSDKTKLLAGFSFGEKSIFKFT
ncbi:HET-domain-containing protein [Rhizodiscina lignyota]|uniref:HET-domain-containing protein n=1 Tax=Rhizodiscina lignyota TaxID=1504668 RepID=A0A9P4M3Y7_9PEZI|nr:HET-domain-containing protein [Rhizodiscina lignyota]